MVLVNVDKGEVSRCTKQYWCILTKEVSRLYVTRHSLGYTSGMDNTVFNSVKLKSIDLVDSIIDFPRFSTICTFWHYQIGIYIATKIHMKRNMSLKYSSLLWKLYPSYLNEFSGRHWRLYILIGFRYKKIIVCVCMFLDDAISRSILQPICIKYPRS